MSNKFFTDEDLRVTTKKLVQRMSEVGYRPDAIVGMVRGGAPVAVLLSHFYNIPCYCFNKTEDMRGLVNTLDQYGSGRPIKHVLVVDDINDTGATLEEFHLQAQTFIDLDCDFSYAVLVDNVGSTFKVDFAGMVIDKNNDPCWIVFVPWEMWWD